MIKVLCLTAMMLSACCGSHARERTIRLEHAMISAILKSEFRTGEVLVSSIRDFIRRDRVQRALSGRKNETLQAFRNLKNYFEQMSMFTKNQPLFSIIDYPSGSGKSNPKMTILDTIKLTKQKGLLDKAESICLITGIGSFPTFQGSSVDCGSGGNENEIFLGEQIGLQTMEQRENLISGQQLGTLPLLPLHHLDDEKVDVFFPGTGFLVANQYVITAAHVIFRLSEEQRRKDLRFVFGCVADGSAKTSKVRFQQVRRYSSTVIQGNPYMPGGEQDWVLIKLDAPLERPGLRLASSYSYSSKSSVFMLGHPRGGAMVKHEGGHILEQDTKMAKYYGVRYKLSLSAFKGNSGSPVFDSSSNTVIGLFVASPPDFHQRKHYTITQEKSVQSMFIGTGQIRKWLVKNIHDYEK